MSNTSSSPYPTLLPPPPPGVRAASSVSRPSSTATLPLEDSMPPKQVADMKLSDVLQMLDNTLRPLSTHFKQKLGTAGKESAMMDTSNSHPIATVRDASHQTYATLSSKIEAVTLYSPLKALDDHVLLPIIPIQHEDTGLSGHFDEVLELRSSIARMLTGTVFYQKSASSLHCMKLSVSVDLSKLCWSQHVLHEGVLPLPSAVASGTIPLAQLTRVQYVCDTLPSLGECGGMVLYVSGIDGPFADVYLNHSATCDQWLFGLEYLHTFNALLHGK